MSKKKREGLTSVLDLQYHQNLVNEANRRRAQQRHLLHEAQKGIKTAEPENQQMEEQLRHLNEKLEALEVRKATAMKGAWDQFSISQVNRKAIKHVNGKWEEDAPQSQIRKSFKEQQGNLYEERWYASDNPEVKQKYQTMMGNISQRVLAARPEKPSKPRP